MQEYASGSSFALSVQSSSSWHGKIIDGLVYLAYLFLNIFYLVIAAVVFLVQRLGDEVLATEQMFLLMTNLYAFMCQFFFFTLCDVTILKSENKHKRGKVVSGLTTLLLYSIFTYFMSKIRDTFMQTFDHYRGPSFSRSLILKFIKVLLEFGKAALVILCLREQGLHYHFDILYSTTTFGYYLCTERLYVEGFIWCVQLLKMNSFDGLEHLYIPIFLHLLGISLTLLILAYLLSMGKYTLYAFLSSYFTLYLPIKNLIWNYLNPLVLERRTFASFRVASEKDLNIWNDICAVCLERMSKARITPCNHFFHPHCLKRCLQSSMQCPLCKFNFVKQE